MLLLGAVVLPTRADQPFTFASTPGKLPKDVLPRHYAIELQPDLEKFTLRGSVVIDLEVLKPTREIILNAHDLEVTKATLLGANEIALKPRLNLGDQTVSFKLPQTLPPGAHRLALEFTGQIQEQAEGLFYVKYSAPSGKKVMLATQMEATDARRMFPCWDEPAFRATFELSVRLPEKFKAYSNMPIESESSVSDGTKGPRFATHLSTLNRIKFVTTPPMASYLVVLVAGELEEISGEAEGVQIRVITTEGKSEQGRYALGATQELLKYYDDYFGIKYPLPKLDQIAIPGGFSGAMENWGGITYNESVLLFDPKTSSEQTKRDVYVDIAHEMSHQWFGNLVTTAWWNNLWLNEGFATWMEVKATDHFNPGWQMLLGAASDKSAVMSGDAHHTTHPIQQAVDNESQADDAFDSITYQKGGAILRMLEDYLGPEAFRQGIHRYLSAHIYSSATTADLWSALERESGQPIHRICGGWTEQPGLPLLKINAACENGKQVVSLAQERFTVQDSRARPLEWEIPVTLATMQKSTATNAVETRRLLRKKSAKLTLADCGGILKANFGDTGYYRVLYSTNLFVKLRQNLNQLPAADRLNLLNDSWAMVEANRSSAADYFALVGALHNEHTLAIWDQILSTLYLIDALEQKQSGCAAFQAHACRLLQPEFKRLGWEPRAGESANDGLLRAKIISGLGQFGDQAVIAEARARFAKFVATPDSLSSDLRSTVLKIAGRYGDQAVHDQLHELALHTSSTEERQLYYSALAGALDPKLAAQTLAISLTDETVPQETTDLVIKVADSGEQPELAWDFARQHLHELLSKVDSSARNDFLPSIMSSFSDTARAEELETYVRKNVSGDALVKARETGEEIRFKAMLKQREIPVIDQWSKPTQPTNPK